MIQRSSIIKPARVSRGDYRHQAAAIAARSVIVAGVHAGHRILVRDLTGSSCLRRNTMPLKPANRG